MRRRSGIVCITLASLVCAAWPTDGSAAKPVTQACLGADLVKSIKCPTGTKRDVQKNKAGGLEVIQCLKIGGPRGTIPIRHGPAIWFQSDGKTVRRAGTYIDHTKVGRWYRFDKLGQLEAIEDYRDDWTTHGWRLRCGPDGKVRYLGYFNKNGREQGRSFHYTGKGKFKYANEWNDGKKTKSFIRKAKAPSDSWCQVRACTFEPQVNKPWPGMKDPTGGYAQDSKVKLTRPPKRSKIGKTY